MYARLYNKNIVRDNIKPVVGIVAKHTIIPTKYRIYPIRQFLQLNNPAMEEGFS